MITMKVAYFALGEKYGSKHAGFVHTFNIVKALSNFVDIKLFIKGFDKNPGVKTTFVKLPSYEIENPIRYKGEFAKIKRDINDVDIIHERFHVNPIDLLFISYKKYILEVNDPAPIIHTGLKGKFYNKIIKLKFNRADAIITQTETMKKILSKFYSGKIYVVPNGVDLKFFSENKNKFDIKKRYKIPDGKIIISFVGAFREWHGVQDIVYIAERVTKIHDNAIFILAGHGPLFNEISERKRDNVILTGPLNHSEIPSLLTQSDILIAPFNVERFESLKKYGFYWCPMKIFEYMASGRSFVSYNFEEIKKITKGSALLARIGDRDQFSEYICKLIENAELRTRLGKKAFELAKKEYSWNDRANQITKIYREIL